MKSWLFNDGTLIMAYHNPHITGVRSIIPIYTLNNQFFFSWLTCQSWEISMDLTGSEYLDCGISTLHSSLQSRFSHLKRLEIWLVVEPTHLKNMSQNGFIFPNQIGVKIKNIWNHHLEIVGFHHSRCRLPFWDFYRRRIFEDLSCIHRFLRLKSTLWLRLYEYYKMVEPGLKITIM